MPWAVAFCGDVVLGFLSTYVESPVEQALAASAFFVSADVEVDVAVADAVLEFLDEVRYHRGKFVAADVVDVRCDVDVDGSV